MREAKISCDEWRKLYEVAIRFRDLECWKWLCDSNIFGVQDPDTGLTGYCSVLGMNREVFALVVYLGSEGLAAISNVQQEDQEEIYTQNCLVASFDNRQSLHKRDLQVIKELGLKFRGKNSWPIFRSYLPGYAPWFLDKSEVRFLTHLLEQASLLVLRLKDDFEILNKEKDCFLVRVAKKQVHKLVWDDQYLKLEPVKLSIISNYGLDELRLYRLREKLHKSSSTWESDIFFSPCPIQEKANRRPYFPRVSLWLDQTSGLIVSYHLADAEHYPQEFREQFLNLLEETNVSPREILVKNDEAYFLLESITNYLHIKLRKVEQLKMLEQAKTGLYEYFMM